MDEIDLTEKELSQALEVKALMDNLLSDQDYQYHQKTDWFSSDRLELILQQLNIPEKTQDFQTYDMNFPLSLSFPDWKKMYSKILSEDDDIRFHQMLLKHMEELEQFRPMYLLKLTLKNELLNYMNMKDQEIEEASDTMNSQELAKLRKQALPLSEMLQELELMPIMIEHQLMDLYVHLPEALSEDLEERTLKTIQQLCIIEHREKSYPQIMEFLTKIPSQESFLPEIMKAENLIYQVPQEEKHHKDELSEHLFRATLQRIYPE